LFCDSNFGGQTNGDLKRTTKFKIIWNGKHIQKQYILKKRFLFFFWKYVKEKGNIKIFKTTNEVMDYIYKQKNLKCCCKRESIYGNKDK